MSRRTIDRWYASAAVLLLVLGISSGALGAQPFTAQIQLALQTLGLWPYGVYSNGECPSWNATTQQFEGGACSGGGGGGAPADATYLTQTANGDLSAEQAIGALASGFMRVATTTGVVTSINTSAGVIANISDETGSGALVFATSPVLATPNLGTPSAVNLTNGTALPIGGINGLGTGVGTALGINIGSAGAPVLFNGALGTPSSGTLTNATGLPVGGITGFGTGVATALAVNIGSAGAPVLFNGALGTPSSGTATNLTGLPIAGITGLGAGVGTWLATPSSANLATAVTDETGTGVLVFGTAPTFTTSIGVTGTANTSYLTGSGFSNTGSDTTSAINYTGTWNTSGAPTFFKINVTQTAVGNPSYLMDLQVGGASMLSVQNNGVITAGNSINSGNLFTYTGSGPALVPLDNNTDPAALLIRNAGNTTALGMKIAVTTESVTTTKATTALESNEMYYTGDTDGQTITLLNDPVRTGLYWHFVVTQTQASNSMSIAPSAGETLRDGASTCSTFTSTVIGSTATITVLTSGAGGLFVVTNKLGTWVCTP